MENLINMEPKEVKNILSDYKNKPNRNLVEVMDYLKEDFEKTKDTIIKLTYHMDMTEKEYNKIYEEYKKRING